jgi:hypothetical protein
MQNIKNMIYNPFKPSKKVYKKPSNKPLNELSYKPPSNKPSYELSKSKNIIDLDALNLINNFITDDKIVERLKKNIVDFNNYKKQNPNNKCLIDIENQLIIYINNIYKLSNLDELENNFDGLYKYLKLVECNINDINDINFITIFNRFKNFSMVLRNCKYIAKRDGGENNKEYINYKFQNKVYRRIVRYDGNLKYIILNKLRVYIKK